MEVQVKINTNEYVECELTDYGRRMIESLRFKPEFKEDTNVIRIQLWELMNRLGEHVFNGAEQVIEGNIITYTAETKREWEK